MGARDRWAAPAVSLGAVLDEIRSVTVCRAPLLRRLRVLGLALSLASLWASIPSSVGERRHLGVNFVQLSPADDLTRIATRACTICVRTKLPSGKRVPGHLFIPYSRLENESLWALSRCPCERPRVLPRTNMSTTRSADLTILVLR